MNLGDRPSRLALSRHWLDYLDALRKARLAASSQGEVALRWEITIAENELVRRGLPPHALELPDRSPMSAAYVPRPWAAPDVQMLFGKTLAETGRKFKDERLIRLGWAHQKTARRQ